MEGDSENKIGKLLFGSIGKKLNWAFGVLILLLAVMIILNYTASNQILQDQIYLKEVNDPLNLMVQQVIGYDAILTGDAHDALLHAEQGEFGYVEIDKREYDKIGAKLDTLLKVDAKNLINKSRRSQADKDKIYGYLAELDRINLVLVDLEVGAFDAMINNDTVKARSLIVSNKYDAYKTELVIIYNKWADEELKVASTYADRIARNSINVPIYGIGIGILFILIAGIISFIMNRKISNPISDIHSAITELERGNLKARVNVKTGDELEDLGNEFNKNVEQLEKIDEERKQVDKAKTEFLSITSHELRSPMTPMKAQLQMLQEDFFGKLNNKQKEAVDIVLRNTDRLDRIIVDFLEISRIEAARLKFNFVKVSLVPYIKRLREEMDAFLPERKIIIDLRVGKLPVMEVDPDRVMQVLRNLINNAKKFSSQNGKIIVNVEQKGDFIEFSVQDNGVGINKESQTRIFEPFFQADNMYQHKSGGTGLGLAICKGIVQSQNGKIWFKSIEGKGTIFYFTIPLTPVRDVKPIKILFSPKTDIENKIRDILVEYLGPLGTKEFEDLKIKGLTEEIFNEYITDLHRKGIILRTEEFKRNIRNVLTGEKEKVEKKKERGIGISDLKKEGLVK